MKKKYSVKTKDRKDWVAFTKQLETVFDKDRNFTTQDTTANIMRRLDLHGLSLDKANEIVRKFIIKSLEDGCKKLLIITGKGLRSKVHNNPYLSEQMNVLKYSVPEFIKNEQDLVKKISKISTASLKDGGEGAFYIFLRKQKNL